MAMAFPSIRRVATAAAFLMLAAAFLPEAASAHALLQSASPPVGGSVGGSPSGIALEFTEGVEPRYSQVSLTGPGGGVPLSRPASGGAKSSVIVRVSQKRKPGRYHFRWSVVSVDTHRTQGSFSFEVQH